MARVRVELPGAGWTDKLASPSWVEDLIREDIIGGPYPVRKIEGRGVGQRFSPRDYRDLLRTLTLKSHGVNRHSAWIAHLWLAGRDIPISRVRDAFRTEAQRVAKGALKDFAPRERLYTEPFGKKYERRIRARKGQSLYPELTDIIEPMAAFGISKRFLSQIATKPEDITRLITEVTGFSANDLSTAIAEMISSLKEGRPPSPDAQQEMQHFIELVAREQGLEVILQSQEFAEAAAQAPANLEGILGTFSVKQPSTLLRTISAATDRQWHITRGMFTAVCSGQLERAFSGALAEATPEHQQLLQLSLSATRQQRELARGTPWVRLHLFVHYLHDLVQRPQRPECEGGSPESPEN